MAADVLYGLYFADVEDATTVLDALWMMSYLAVGLAALLPSMRGLTEQQAAEKEDGSSRAMLGLLVATAVLAVTNVTDEATLGVPLLGEAAEIMLVGLLFLRAYEAGRREARHERRIAALLANASDALTVVGKDGRILLSNAAAARVIGGPASSRPVSRSRISSNFSTPTTRPWAPSGWPWSWPRRVLANTAR